MLNVIFTKTFTLVIDENLPMPSSRALWIVSAIGAVFSGARVVRVEGRTIDVTAPVDDEEQIRTWFSVAQYTYESTNLPLTDAQKADLIRTFTKACVTHTGDLNVPEYNKLLASAENLSIRNLFKNLGFSRLYGSRKV